MACGDGSGRRNFCCKLAYPPSEKRSWAADSIIYHDIKLIIRVVWSIWWCGERVMKRVIGKLFNLVLQSSYRVQCITKHTMGLRLMHFWLRFTDGFLDKFSPKDEKGTIYNLPLHGQQGHSRDRWGHRPLMRIQLKQNDWTAFLLLRRSFIPLPPYYQKSVPHGWRNELTSLAMSSKKD